MIVVAGARALTTAGWQVCDVAIEGATVVGVGAVEHQPDYMVIDSSGLMLGPGFVDLHTHLRDPGQTWKEDMASGSAAAARGGFTAVLAMPNTEPAIDTGEMVRRCRHRAADTAVVEVGVSGALSMGRNGEEMAHLEDMYDEGVRLFTDDGDTLTDGGLLRRIMIYLSDRDDVVIAQHAEDPAIASGGDMHEGSKSQTLGLVGLPASAEVAVIARDLALAAETGARYHIQHLSTSGGVSLVRRAKEDGLEVTAEVTPHHLMLTDDDLTSLDPNMKMYPPLRSPADREALLAALHEGVIDAVATDHAPHAASEKDVPFEEAPRGVIGLETAFPVTLAAADGDLDLVFDRMSISPARIGAFQSQGRPVEVGSPANLVLVDPTESWVAGSFASRSANSPFIGQELKGRVVATIVNGEVVHGDGR
ncbi:MAG: dihydroorotase [Acidimicrobiia bacterium]